MIEVERDEIGGRAGGDPRPARGPSARAPLTVRHSPQRAAQGHPRPGARARCADRAWRRASPSVSRASSKRIEARVRVGADRDRHARAHSRCGRAGSRRRGSPPWSGRRTRSTPRSASRSSSSSSACVAWMIVVRGPSSPQASSSARSGAGRTPRATRRSRAAARRRGCAAGARSRPRAARSPRASRAARRAGVRRVADRDRAARPRAAAQARRRGPGRPRREASQKRRCPGVGGRPRAAARVGGQQQHDADARRRAPPR